ncbi:MAG: type ISP restriction/modification enzyme [Methylococcales bacterium]|nr:type ISP restriction/modification enzyme [Methylococcales bacterium]
MPSAIQTYLQDIACHLQAGNSTEHTHRPALQTLLQSILPEYHITNEPRRIACGAPDFEIAKGSEPIGHIEAKDVGIDLNKVQKSEQLARYTASLNNLLLTDYLEFRWFVNGEYKADMTVKLAELGKNGALKIYPEAFDRLENLFKSVVESQIITLRSPEELAKKMAHIARLMNDVLIKAYGQEDDNGKLHAQLSSFREVLIDTLSVEEFADMVAQTICYGLFTAKCSAMNAEFSRLTAVHFVPKTNPFLRQFFNQLAGIELDERLVWMVEHLVAVLNRADIGAILADFGKRTRREDPVVHFYETFLANYDAKLREVRGVYYTPEPVVSYIVRSVDLILKNQFGLREGLADSSQIPTSGSDFSRVDVDSATKVAPTMIHKVQILDPATGTGTFLYAVIAQIYQQVTKRNNGCWSDYVSKHLLPRVHGFELLMAAYTVAHIKLSLQLKDYGYDFKSDERLRVFLTNTLDEAHGKQTTLLSEWLSNEANAASSVKRDSPVMVILGNPPYSGHSANTGAWISDLLRSAGTAANYFQVDGQSLNERNPKWLNDDYVKFIRFAHWRIMQTGYGVLAFVTNHGYLDNPTFRGMRQSLLQDFDEIYILDLHGNSKKKETAPDGSVDKNVFDIQQGVAIGIFIKHQQPIKGGREFIRSVDDKSANKFAPTKIHHAHLYGERQSKYQYLAEQDINTTDWKPLKPQAPFYLFVPQDTDLLPEYQAGWKVTEMMPVNVLGFQTHRDDFAIAFEKETIVKRMQDMRATDLSDSQLLEKYELKESTSWKLEKVRKSLRNLKNWESNITQCLYRPFDTRYCYFSETVMDRPRRELQSHVLGRENLLINLTRIVKLNHWQHSLVTNVPSTAICMDTNGSYAFPLYLYPTQQSSLFDHDPDHDTRKPNFSPAFIADLETRLQLTFIPEDKGDFEQTISALDVFHTMYAVFHSPTYRTRYAEFLKMDFPRLPLISDKALFKQLADLGEQLVSLHLMDGKTNQGLYDSEHCFPIAGDNLVEKIDYQDNKIYINKTQYFDSITPELWAFHIGGYQVCQKWLKDRKGKHLSYDDCNHYLSILAALEHTHTLMLAIDDILVFPIL